MKKFFTLIATALVALTASAEYKITWSEAASAGSLPATYSSNGLVLTRTDDNNKHAVDANNAYFGDADSQEKFAFRFKTGGTGGSKNALSLTVPVAGTLKVCARTASSSSPRAIVINGVSTTLDDSSISVDMEGNISETNPTGATKVYPVISVPVTAGTISINYPDGAVNIYSIELVAGGGSGEGGDEPVTPTPSGDVQEITWSEAVAAGSLAAAYGSNGFVLTRTDGNNKHAIDANNAYFGDASAQTKYSFRFKTGGTGGSKNALSLSIPSKGTLEVCARTASSSSPRAIVINGVSTTLDDSSISVDMEGNISETNPTGATKVYPVISVPVTAGNISIGYPDGAVNIYSLKFIPEGAATAVEAIAETKAEAPKAVKVIKNGKLFIGNFNVAGQQVK